MARRRKKAGDAGTYEDVTGSGGRVGPSAFPERSPAEVATLRRLLQVENPPEGVDTRPYLIDRILHRPGGVEPGPGPWSSFVYGTKVVGRGKNKMIVPRHIPWRTLELLGAVILAGYILERAVMLIGNWWPGSSLGASSWSAITAPVTFGQWVAQHLNVSHGMTVIQSTVTPAMNPVAQLQSLIPNPILGTVANIGGTSYRFDGSAWQAVAAGF